MDNWTKHVENTFNDERQHSNDILEDRTSPLFTIDEMRTAIRRTKYGKATGPIIFFRNF